MKNISIDIETFSDVDLQKCGVYKYAQSENFEILLFGYSVDGGEVAEIDIAQGEGIPTEIIDALTDEQITKWAFNANFERVCLSEYLRRFYPEKFVSYSTKEDSVSDYLDPSSWKCSMVWAAYMGLPLSLAGAGAVLGLEEQKLTEGKELIRYFCVPCKATKVNGGRTRNLPQHDMSKWEMFKKYNKRDVEVEMSIQDKLRNFSVPDFVWEEYHLDQEINDRGIALDMGLEEEELQPLVDMWREANPNIVRYWWDVDRAVKKAVKQREPSSIGSVRFLYKSGMLFIELPSGRRLCYVKPKMGVNKFGSESVTYEGVGAAKKWERIESYGPKFVENIVQAISRDILMYAIRTLSYCFICGHVHDELIIECSKDVSLDVICEQMGRTPPWIPDILLRADGYETEFYKKD